MEILIPSIHLFQLTLNVRGPSYLGLTRSLSWLLMPWLLTSPGHQQPWYWLCRIGTHMRPDYQCPSGDATFGVASLRLNTHCTQVCGLTSIKTHMILIIHDYILINHHNITAIKMNFRHIVHIKFSFTFGSFPKYHFLCTKAAIFGIPKISSSHLCW